MCLHNVPDRRILEIAVIIHQVLLCRKHSYTPINIRMKNFSSFNKYIITTLIVMTRVLAAVVVGAIAILTRIRQRIVDGLGRRHRLLFIVEEIKEKVRLTAAHELLV